MKNNENDNLVMRGLITASLIETSTLSLREHPMDVKVKVRMTDVV